jgi:WD40 repeat protein
VFILKSEYRIHEGPIYAIGIADTMVFTGSSDKTVKSLDLNTGNLLPFTVRSESAPISLLSIHAELLAIGYLTGEFYLINPTTRNVLFEYHFTGDGIFSLCVLNSLTLAIGLGSGRLGMLDFVDYEWLYLEQITSDKIRAMVYQDSTQSLYLASKSGEIVVFNTEEFNIQARWHAHDGGVNCLLLASSNQLVSGGKDGHITRWEGQERVKSIPAHRGVIYGILEVGESLISCSRDKSIKVWEMETWKPLQKITFHQQSVNQLVQQNVHSFVTASDDHRIAHWVYAE